MHIQFSGHETRLARLKHLPNGNIQMAVVGGPNTAFEIAPGDIFSSDLLQGNSPKSSGLSLVMGRVEGDKYVSRSGPADDLGAFDAAKVIRLARGFITDSVFFRLYHGIERVLSCKGYDIEAVSDLKQAKRDYQIESLDLIKRPDHKPAVIIMGEQPRRGRFYIVATSDLGNPEASQSGRKRQLSIFSLSSPEDRQLWDGHGFGEEDQAELLRAICDIVSPEIGAVLAESFKLQHGKELQDVPVAKVKSA